jgi:hypothetical protein
VRSPYGREAVTASQRLVVAKGLNRQGQQRWSFFGEHGRDLPFGRAMDARIGPARFPLIKGKPSVNPSGG